MSEVLQRVILVVFAPLALLTVLEFGLWCFDIAPPEKTASAVRQSGIMGEGWNAASYSKRLSRQPPNGRVICFGGSSMAGNPLSNDSSMCNLVGDALDPKAETVNSASAALDSQDVRTAMEVACQYEHRLMLLYSGHNEFLNLQYFAHEAPAQVLSDTAELLSVFRFFRWFQSFTAQDAATVSELSETRVDNAAVFKRYERNLRTIFEACKGRKLIVSTVVSNQALRNPRGATLRESHRRGTLKPVPLHETCRECFRAPEIINLTIRRLAKEYGVPLVEAERALQSDPPNDLFWDHVHPRPELHERIATLFLETAKAAGYIEGYGKPAANVPAKRLASAAAERAFFNLQFDPRLAMQQITETSGVMGTATEQFGVALAAFVLDDMSGVQVALRRVSDILAQDTELRRRWNRCDPRTPGCFPLRREQLMSSDEHQELVAHARTLDLHPAVIARLERL